MEYKFRRRNEILEIVYIKIFYLKTNEDINLSINTVYKILNWLRTSMPHYLKDFIDFTN